MNHNATYEARKQHFYSVCMIKTIHEYIFITGAILQSTV